MGIQYRSHDAAAALVRDGQIVAAIAEERLSRVKHDAAFPERAIAWCLERAGITTAQLDHVVWGWPRPTVTLRHDLRNFARGNHPVSRHNVVSSALAWQRLLRERGGMKTFNAHFGAAGAQVRWLDHHRAHAVSAFATSGWDDAAVLVVDGRGATEATTLWRGQNGALKLLETIPWPNSLGLFYATFTHYLGFTRYSDEWKVMGLAPYGGPGVDLGAFVRVGADDYEVNAPALLGDDPDDVRALVAALGPRREPEAALDDRHKAIAWAVQDACERALLALARRAVNRTGQRRLCLAGGVALNAKGNGLLLQSGAVDDVWVFPAAGDDGCAVGAALDPWWDGSRRVGAARIGDVFWGPDFTDDEGAATLDRYKIAYRRCADVGQVAAEMIAAGRIVGWFQGRAEFGPRALGARSILADARDAGMLDRVNNAVKFREAWRPFAPAVLAEHAAEWFVGCGQAPFMILTFPVRADRQAQIPAVTHADCSARVQTVDAAALPRYRRVLAAFHALTGVPVVLDTSFNLRGEPIVTTPTEAVRTFYSSGLDALVIGDCVVTKA